LKRVKTGGRGKSNSQRQTVVRVCERHEVQKRGGFCGSVSADSWPRKKETGSLGGLLAGGKRKKKNIVPVGCDNCCKKRKGAAGQLCRVVLKKKKKGQGAGSFEKTPAHLTVFTMKKGISLTKQSVLNGGLDEGVGL